MTALTPQQMRELETDAFAALQESIGSGRITMRIPADEQRDTDLRIAKALAALRAAADQIEAVQRVADSHRSDAETAACIVSVRLDAILTADTAPQENRMSKCDWPECPGYSTIVEKHEIESGPELHPSCKDAILLTERARREGWHDINGNQKHR
ncbi:hypothetical protein NYQ35_16015 [Curtobacterium flaccumfaciens pv. flaccumfaciens]|uniref:hypothetical protein n=1 Tax=Curtobacterium flaccumfaciens TaxID=2035 RepID=UPI00217DE9ED|nr:hypothetical protein [Curtobacterium flaccumfaciens]MCS6570312.1 hypothetical protein [Curtobacterium flaccumfaciens pv. flaccumfaciens]MCS6585168.1 hypothetical protein [Curtobacterium flaccumfaciens pv. flaccumfaciens]